MKLFKPLLDVLFFLKHCQQDTDFNWINKVMKKSDLTRWLNEFTIVLVAKLTVESLDKIKKLGFYYSTVGGISLLIG